jgi:hypothetical protein
MPSRFLALPRGARLRYAGIQVAFTSKRCAKAFVSELRRAGFVAWLMVVLPRSEGGGAIVGVRGAEFTLGTVPLRVTLQPRKVGRRA